MLTNEHKCVILILSTFEKRIKTHFEERKNENEIFVEACYQHSTVNLRYDDNNSLQGC